MTNRQLKSVVPNLGGISTLLLEKLPIHYKCCTSFQVVISSFNYLFHFIFVSFLVEYHTVLLTNFSSMIWLQIVYVLLLLINLLSSIKTVVPIVVNTSLRIRPGEEWNFQRGGVKNSKMSKIRNASKKVGNHWLKCKNWNQTKRSGVDEVSQCHTQERGRSAKIGLMNFEGTSVN